MGQALSKNPIREISVGVSIIAGLCLWLEKEVNAPHQAPRSKKSKKQIESNFLQLNKPTGMTRNNLSFASLNRLERLQRAVELKRSVPHSYKMGKTMKCIYFFYRRRISLVPAVYIYYVMYIYIYINIYIHKYIHTYMIYKYN